MSEDKKSYYAIIPANVRYDKELTANAKLLYGEITALTNEKGYCWASNNYFADLYGVTPQAISRWVNILAKKGYVNIEYERKGKEITQRKIFIAMYKQKVNTVSINSSEGINKKLTGYQQIVKENNTVNNKFNNISFDNNNDINENVNTHKPSKHKYGQYNHVLLDDEQYNKLVSSLGEKEAQRMINTLDEGIELKGYTYKNHYLAIIKWKQKENSNFKTKEIKETVLCSCHNKNKGYESDVYYNKGSVCPICILEGKI